MEELNLLELETLQGGWWGDCFISAMGGVGAIACAASSATPATFWYSAGCISLAAASGVAIGKTCFG